MSGDFIPCPTDSPNGRDWRRVNGIRSDGSIQSVAEYSDAIGTAMRPDTSDRYYDRLDCWEVHARSRTVYGTCGWKLPVAIVADTEADATRLAGEWIERNGTDVVSFEVVKSKRCCKRAEVIRA